MDSIFSVFGSYVTWDVKGLLLFAAVFILTADYIKNRRLGSFPPGPRALPIVGNIFSVDYNRTHESLTQLAGRYGDVYSLRMGQAWIVVLNGFEVLKEALVRQGDSLVDRPDLPLLQDISQGLGVIFSNGNSWKQQRRFALSTLKHFGFGKKSLEPVILEELTYCVKEFKSHKGKAFDPHLILNNAVSNIICSLVFGHRFEYGDEKFMQLMSWFSKGLELEGSIWAQLYNAFPLLMRRLPGPHQTIHQIWNSVKDFIRVELKEHQQNWDPTDKRDYIDCYLNEIQMSKGQADNTFDEENLVACVWDLLLAGSETTSTTLRWAFLYMVKYPEIQAKVQAEIDEMIGQSRRPSMEDRADLPYTEAVLHEIQRMSNIVPLSLPHATTRDIQLGGYTIPKLYNAFPVLMRRLPGPHHALQNIYGEIMDLIKREVDKHKEDWNPSEPRDFIDCYLNEIQKRSLVMCGFDLFGAGSHTISVTLRWALLYMSKYPDIQAKVQAEIDGLVGRSRQPSMKDCANLPYTDAVIHEVQRMSNIVPLSLPHATNRDIQLGGYTIPKGVTIIPNMTSVMFDKNEWETPDTFNPGHFLNEEGKFVKRAAFIPFSAGKRLCLGENLAKMELFLFFTSFMQCFSFSTPPGVEPELKPRFGVTLSPHPFEICATPRKE